MDDLILPAWPAPANVRALQTTRRGGVSAEPFASLNLGDHVGDDPTRVAANRARLAAALPAMPCWLSQVHGVLVVDAAGPAGCQADASFSRQPGAVCAVMTADCLPVLFCDRNGSVVAAAHAGWRGLVGGILEATLDAMGRPSGEVMAWLGPAIGPQAFEVGDDVRQACLAADVGAAACFVPCRPGKYLADLYTLARRRLLHRGVTHIYGGEYCTFQEADCFFSYRRDGVTGRMASLIWLERV